MSLILRTEIHGRAVSRKKKSLKEPTFETHSISYRNVIKPGLGHHKLQQIAPIQIQKFVNDLVNNTSYSEHTIHLIFRIVSASLKKSKVLKLIKDNPAEGITLSKIKRREISVWSLE